MNTDPHHLRTLSMAEQLARVSRLWKSVVDRELAPLGLTHPRWTALWKLRRLGGNVGQKPLADALEIELASLMRTLNQLEEQGLIVRTSCPHDKRVRMVSLTEEGEALLDKMQVRILQVRQQLFTDISQEELDTLKNVLEQMSHNAFVALESDINNK